MSRLLRTAALAVVLATAAVSAAVSGASAQAPAPGFQVELGGTDHVECFVIKAAKRLDCLNYAATASGSCDFGGAVDTVRLTRSGKPKRATSCVDEGYHGWKKLRAGKTWRSSGFRCRVSNDATTLACWNARGRHRIYAAS